MAKYWMQSKAPAGNWVDRMGSESVHAAIDQAGYDISVGKEARVVERVDTVVWPVPTEPKLRWDKPPHGKDSRIADVNGHRLYVRRTAKGSRSFTGLINGNVVGTWDNINMAMSQTAKAAREHGLLKEEGDASNTSTQP